MKIRLIAPSPIDRRITRLLRRYRPVLQQPNMDVLKRDLSIERVIAYSLNAEPEPVRNEPRWCCPFHADTNPSLWARDEKRRWGCNPCGISGDVFDWVMRYHELPLNAAMRLLQRHYERFRA